VVDSLDSPDEFRKLAEKLRLGIGFVGSVNFARALDTRSIAGPDLHFAVAGLDIQGVLGSAIGPQQRDRVWMVKARQVPEVAVLAEGILCVSGAQSHARALENRDRVGAQGVAHSLASLFEHPPILPRISRSVAAKRGSGNSGVRQLANPLDSLCGVG